MRRDGWIVGVSFKDKDLDFMGDSREKGMREAWRRKIGECGRTCGDEGEPRATEVQSHEYT